MAGEINITVSRSFTTRVKPTPHVKACAAMFGIGIDEEHRIALYEGLGIRLGFKRIIYVTGDSGAGKSCLLKDVRAKLSRMKRASVIEQPSVETSPDEPLIEQFGDWGFSRIAELLNYVGISEPFIYCRCPRELSDGQRYRFFLAQMIHSAMHLGEGTLPVILVDEFLAFLDRETARNVAYQVRRVSSRFGLCFIVATTHNDFVRDLQPNMTITMRLNMEPHVNVEALAGL